MSKRDIGLLVWAFLAPSVALAADLPKEGSFKLTFFGTEVLGKRTTLPTADGKTASIDESSYTYFNDAGGGFLHEATGRCLVSGTSDDKGFHRTGPCTYADPDGDLIFSTFDIQGGGGRIGGTKEYIGGTGKYAGLTGHATFTVAPLKTVDKDSPRSYEGHVQGTYRLGGGSTATVNR